MFSNLTGFFFVWFFRNKNTLLTIAFLNIVLVFLMTLGFSDLKNVQQYFPSIFLISIFFVGQFFLVQTHNLLAQDKTLQSLLLTGQPASFVFLSSLLVSTIWLFLVAVCLWILMHFFFQVPLVLPTPAWLLVMLSGLISYLSLGLLFYGFGVYAKVATGLILILFFPLLIPLFLYWHQGLILLGTSFTFSSLWPMLGMNLLFVFSSMVLYEFIAEDLT